MYDLLSNIASATVPAPVAAGVGLFGLAAGLWWMRAAARDQRAAAVRTASAASTYWVRAETTHSYIRAIETPTQQIDMTELRAATATRRERLADWAHDLVERTTQRHDTPADWAEGEMTAAFRAIVDGNDWERADELTLPAKASPWASPIAAGPAPAPSAPPAIVHAPRGPQAPPRWVDGGTPPVRRSPRHALPARERDWSLMGPVPRLELPEFPAPFRSSVPSQHRGPDPRVMARLPHDETRQFRTRVVAA